MCSARREHEYSSANSCVTMLRPFYKSFHILSIRCFSLPLGCWLLRSTQSATTRTSATAQAALHCNASLQRGYSKSFSNATTCVPTVLADLNKTLFRDGPCITRAKDNFRSTRVGKPSQGVCSPGGVAPDFLRALRREWRDVTRLRPAYS